MRQRHLDRLFARFRSRGDARALAKVFDATAPELYRVATHLTKDLHAAEDLVQSTFLAAIEARESWDESRSLLPWLIGILARQAAYERRRRSRTIEPARLEQRDASDPAETLEAQELSDELLRAIDGIPTLYRQVLVAHLKQGKTPQEIARDLGRAPGTVRVQLHRALELLRKSLPAGLATGGLVAALSPRGLSAVRAAVLRSAMRVSVPVAATGGVSSITVIGGLAMSSKAVFTVAGILVCLTLVGRLVLRGSGLEHAEAGSAQLSPEDAAGVVTPDPAVTPVEGSTAPSTERIALEPSVPVAPRSNAPWPQNGNAVSGRFLMPDGSPASGAFVALLKMVDGYPGETAQETKTAGDGAFDLRAAPGPHLVVGLSEDLLPIAQPVAISSDANVRLEPAMFQSGAAIRGHVRILGSPARAGCGVSALWRPDGRAVRLHDQDLVWSDARLMVAYKSCRTDDQGRFALAGLEPQLHQVSVENTPERRILHAVFDVPAPTEDAELVVEGARVVLRVQSDHKPVEAKITLNENGRGRGNVWGFLGQSSVDVLVTPGTFFAVDVEEEGYSGAEFDLHAPDSGETIEKEVELVRKTDGAELAIELVTSDGRMIQEAGFGLFATKGTHRDRFRILRPGPDGRMPEIVRDEKVKDGVFHLQDLPPDRYRVVVVAEGTWERGSTYWYGDPLDVDLSANSLEQRRIDLRLGGHLRIACANRRGESLGARCKLFDAGGTEIPWVFFTQDEHGSTWLGGRSLNASAPRGTNEVFPSLPPGQYEVRLSLDGYREASHRATVEPGRVCEVTITLEDD